MSIENKAIDSAFSMIVRFFATQTIVVVASVFLARWLSPQDFGFYAILLVIINFLQFFGNAGLGAALIQQKAKIQPHDLAVIFTFQSTVSLVIIGFGTAVSLILRTWTAIPPIWLWAIQVLIWNILLTGIRSIAALQCERELAFGVIAKVETLEVFIFQISALILASNGFGPWSFIWALSLRTIIGTVCLTVARPWRPRWVWDWPRVRTLLRFGLPYQGVPFISLIKDSIAPILIGLTLGGQAVGYTNWASTMSTYPLIFSSVVTRVTFATFSRLQDDPRSMKQALEAALRINSTVAYGIFAIMIGMARPLVALVFTNQWLPALPLYYMLATVALCAPITNLLLVALSSIGRSKEPFLFALLWAIATWVFGVPAILWYGLVGYGIATMAVFATNIVVVRYSRRFLSFDVWANVRAPLGATCVTIGVLLAGHQVFPIDTLIGMASASMLGMAIYTACLGVLSQGQLWRDTRRIWRQLAKRPQENLPA